MEQGSGGKFFKEMKGSCHLDARYGRKRLSGAEIQRTLLHLLSKFMRHCSKTGIKPILMHGGLIGYYFNNRMLPWDGDLDLIICDEDSKRNLKNKSFGDLIIEVNPNCDIYTSDDKRNKIAARVISRTNGVFIDITFFRENADRTALLCKDGHVYRTEDIYLCTRRKVPATGLFHNVPVYVPNNIVGCLVREYGRNVLKPYYKNYVFDVANKTWYKKRTWGFLA